MPNKKKELLRVLVVDDELAIRRYLRTSLSAHEYQVFEAHDGRDAIREVVSKRPDLIILDLGLPDISGVEVTRQLREWSQIPIIILSVRDHEDDKILALDAGADDYLTKPFSAGELMARMRVAMRRSLGAEQEPIFESGRLRVDLASREVQLNGQTVSLTPTEYDLLRELIQEAGKVLTHAQLFRAVWGSEINVDSHLLRVNISNLRHKIEADASRPTLIITEPGVGYRLRG
jgi:two-component system KDP operon response regulator KdpE